MIKDGITLKILIISPLYPPYSGGSSIYFSTLINYLQENLAEILVLTTRCPNIPLKRQHSNIQIYRTIPMVLNYPKLIGRPIIFVMSFLSIIYLLIFKKPDLIHAHSGTAIAFGIGLINRFLPLHTILELRDLDTIEKSTFKLKTCEQTIFITSTRKTHKMLVQRGFKEKNIYFIPLVNPPLVSKIAERFQQKIVDNSRTLIKLVFVGNLTKEKGIDILLKAFKSATEKISNLNLTIVGEGKAKENCKFYIREEGLKNKAKILGALDHENALEIIGKSDIVVVPSRRDLQPRVIMEAFQLEKPVIASHVGAIPEVIKPGYNGLLFRVENVEELENNIILLAENKKLKREMGIHARKTFERQPSWNTFIQKIESIYISVARKSRLSGKHPGQKLPQKGKGDIRTQRHFGFNNMK